ncbi:hypothetical protein, partial [Vibrio cincinnatiensis]|uniref:hypothetical protein n=1 Tax=Vibrio cincinnatiensis TaxID=675 RepID=UPI001FA9B632
SLAENTDTTNPLKVADIAITDDGLGSNDISLSGIDAAFFEVIGQSLFLKAGTVLNFESKASYTATVNVDDDTVGSTPDLTADFKLT